MAFRMSEQPRTITIYNLLAGTKNLLVKVMHIFRLIQVCQQTVPILHHQIFLLALWLFSTVMRHRGISLKTIGVKRFMTWLPATRYLFLNSVRYRKMLPVVAGRGIRSGTAQHGEGYGSRKTVPDPGGRRNKNSLMQVASEHIAPLQDAVDLEIATEEENSLLEARKKYRVLLNRVDTSTAPDIEWPEEPDTV